MKGEAGASVMMGNSPKVLLEQCIGKSRTDVEAFKGCSLFSSSYQLDVFQISFRIINEQFIFNQHLRRQTENKVPAFANALTLATN